MKMEVRGFTIAYAKRKVKKKRNEEKLQEQLNELLAQSAQCKTNPLLTENKDTKYSNEPQTNNRPKSKRGYLKKQS